MNKFCHSCSMPLADDDHSSYCQYCADEKGNLKPKTEIQAGIAEWLKQWAPEGDSTNFMKRAEYFMKAMPAWAEK